MLGVVGNAKNQKIRAEEDLHWPLVPNTKLTSDGELRFRKEACLV